jgi:hypothetical protein
MRTHINWDVHFEFVDTPACDEVDSVPPAGSDIRANSITPAMLREINAHIKSDVKSDVILECTSDISGGIFITTSAVLSPSIVACALKHVRRLVTTPGVVPIQVEPATSTSYLKVLDVPYVPADPCSWIAAQRTAFTTALRSSLVGSLLDRYIKHAPCFMHTTRHADTCVAWVDISDMLSSSNAKQYIGKSIVIGGATCQIWGFFFFFFLKKNSMGYISISTFQVILIVPTTLHCL